MKNKHLTFNCDFPCWGAGEIPQLASKNKQIPIWCSLETNFLTSASRLHNDLNWLQLVEELGLADSSYTGEFASADSE